MKGYLLLTVIAFFLLLLLPVLFGIVPLGIEETIIGNEATSTSATQTTTIARN